jgi:hypothetical protein
MTTHEQSFILGIGGVLGYTPSPEVYWDHRVRGTSQAKS